MAETETLSRLLTNTPLSPIRRTPQESASNSHDEEKPYTLTNRFIASDEPMQGENPFLLYDRPNRDAVTAALKRAVEQFAQDYRRLLNLFPDMGASDTATREAIGQAVFDVISQD